MAAPQPAFPNRSASAACSREISDGPPVLLPDCPRRRPPLVGHAHGRGGASPPVSLAVGGPGDARATPGAGTGGGADLVPGLRSASAGEQLVWPHDHHVYLDRDRLLVDRVGGAHEEELCAAAIFLRARATGRPLAAHRPGGDVPPGEGVLRRRAALHRQRGCGAGALPTAGGGAAHAGEPPACRRRCRQRRHALRAGIPGDRCGGSRRRRIISAEQQRFRRRSQSGGDRAARPHPRAARRAPPGRRPRRLHLSAKLDPAVD